jgi:hypothetical protein
MQADSRQTLRAFLAAAALLFAAWLPRLVPNAYSSDDYVLLHGEVVDQSIRMYATQGRFGMAALSVGLTALGASPVHAYTALNLVAIALLAAASVQLLRIWDLERDWPLAPLLCALAFVHPFAAETWSFRIAPFYFASAVSLALWGLALIRRGRGQTSWGIALIIASLSIYQVGLNPILVAIGIGACLDLWRVGPSREGVAATVKVWLITLGAVVAACAAYFVLVKLVLAVLGIGMEARSELLPLRDVPWQLKQIARTLPMLLGHDRHLGAPLLEVLQISLLAAALLLAAWRARVEGWGKAVLTVALLGLSLVAVIGLHAALRAFHPWPRVMTAAGLFWAGVFALALQLSGPRLRPVLVGALALIAFGYVGLDHRAAGEQGRLNARELLLAGRIADRLDRLPGQSGARRLVAVGHARDYPDFGTTEGDLQISAFYIPWSQAALVAEASGRDLDPASDAERARAEQRCKEAPKWPAEGAVSLEGELAIVCF